MDGTEYCQILDGRIRIKIPEVKGSHQVADELERLLGNFEGVAHVKANPLTGDVWVLFDPQIISHYQVFAVINDFNCLNG